MYRFNKDPINLLNSVNPIINKLFYTLKPLIPRSTQIALRRLVALRKRQKSAHIWPIDPNSAKPPEGWSGWPEGRQFALVLSHDVDTRKGYNNVLRLADLEEGLGFRSQFNFVPERYGKVEIGLLDELKRRGFADRRARPAPRRQAFQLQGDLRPTGPSD